MRSRIYTVSMEKRPPKSLSLSRFGRRKRHGFNPGLFVFWPRLSLSHGDARGYKNMRISPELFQEMLNPIISVVCPVRSMVNHDQVQTTDHIGICYGYAAVASTVI